MGPDRLSRAELNTQIMNNTLDKSVRQEETMGVFGQNEVLGYDGAELEHAAESSENFESKKDSQIDFVKELKKNLSNDNFTVAALKETSKGITNAAVYKEVQGYIMEFDKNVNNPEKLYKMYNEATDLKKAVATVYWSEQVDKVYNNIKTEIDNEIKNNNKPDNFTTRQNKLNEIKKEHKKDPAYTEAIKMYKAEMDAIMDGQLYIDLRNIGYKKYLKKYNTDEEVLQQALNYRNRGMDLQDDDLKKAEVIEARKSDKVYEQYVKGRKGASGLAKRRDDVDRKREELKNITDAELKSALKPATYNAIQPYAELFKKYDLSKLSDEDLKSALGDETYNELNEYMSGHKNEDNTYNLSELPNDKPEVYDTLKTYLDENKKDGNFTYDLSRLSQLIELRTGKDLVLSAAAEDPKHSEQKLIGTKLPSEVAGMNISDEENEAFKNIFSNKKITKDLLNYCGFEVEGKDHTVKWLKNLTEAFNGFVAGEAADVAVAATVGHPIVVKAMAEAHAVAIPGISEAHAYAHTVVEKVIYNSALDGILPAGIAGAAVGYASQTLHDVLIGNEIPVEETCFEAKSAIQYNNIDEYIDYLKKNDVEGYNKVKDRLDWYKNDAENNSEQYENQTYKWDIVGFIREFDVKAGVDSNLNCNELNGETYKNIQPDKPTPKAKRGIIVDKTETEPHEETVPVTVREDQLTGDDKIIFTKTGNKSGWGHLTTLYDCGNGSLTDLNIQQGNKSRRMLQLVYAISNSDYSAENMEKLYALYRKDPKGLKYLKNVEGFDINAFKRATGAFPSDIKLPKEIYYKKNADGSIVSGSGFTRCEISEDEHELIAPKVPKSKQATGSAAKVRPGSAAYGTTTTMVSHSVPGSSVETVRGFIIDENGTKTIYNNQDEYDKASEELKGRLGEENIQVLSDEETEKELNKKTEKEE